MTCPVEPCEPGTARVRGSGSSVSGYTLGVPQVLEPCLRSKSREVVASLCSMLRLVFGPTAGDKTGNPSAGPVQPAQQQQHQQQNSALLQQKVEEQVHKQLTSVLTAAASAAAAAAAAGPKGGAGEQGAAAAAAAAVVPDAAACTLVNAALLVLECLVDVKGTAPLDRALPLLIRTAHYLARAVVSKASHPLCPSLVPSRLGHNHNHNHSHPCAFTPSCAHSCPWPHPHPQPRSCPRSCSVLAAGPGSRLCWCGVSRRLAWEARVAVARPRVGGGRRRGKGRRRRGGGQRRSRGRARPGHFPPGQSHGSRRECGPGRQGHWSRGGGFLLRAPAHGGLQPAHGPGPPGPARAAVPGVQAPIWDAPAGPPGGPLHGQERGPQDPRDCATMGAHGAQVRSGARLARNCLVR